MNLTIALAALVVERIVGYPQWLVARIGHPVIWMGWLIEKGEAAYNDPGWADEDRRFAGGLVVGAVVLAVAMITLALAYLLRTAVPLGFLIEAVLAGTLLAQRELGIAVGRVARGLEGSLAEGRAAVSHIVGRDTAALDEAEIARAAIETLAENASDGVIAPLLYLCLFGLPGIAVYKAINTADSMIGHKSDRYHAFGYGAAKLDDVVNFVPSRLTALLFALAALVIPQASASGAFAAARRDARKHASPNAGWPEATLAGALGFGLGGPRSYRGEMLELPRMGDGRRNLAPGDIDRALALYRAALWITLGLVAVLAGAWLLSR